MGEVLYLKGMQPFFFILALFAIASLQADSGEGERWLDIIRQHEAFRAASFPLHEKEFVRLIKEGQSPRALFIGCSDSRVVPDLILGTGPGDLFQIRAAGNFVPVWTPNIAWDGIQASIEYAVEVLKIQEIVICGHSHCGAIEGLFKGVGDLTAVRDWIRFGLPAKVLVDQTLPESASIAEKTDRAARISVILQLEHLMTYPFIREKVKEKKLFLHGWYYIIEEGKILYYDPESNRFRSLSELL